MRFNKSIFFVSILFLSGFLLVCSFAVIGIFAIEKSKNTNMDQAALLDSVSNLRSNVIIASQGAESYLDSTDSSTRLSIKESLEDAAKQIETNYKSIKSSPNLSSMNINIDDKTKSQIDSLYNNLRRFFNVDTRISDEKAYLKKIISTANSGLLLKLEKESGNALSVYKENNLRTLEEIRSNFLIASILVISLLGAVIFIALRNLIKNNPAKVSEEITKDLVVNESNNFDDYTILIAEDNRVSLEFSTSMLEDFGCTIIKSTNGQEAIDAITGENKDKVSFVLMDCEMPVMDGLEATKKMKQLVAENVISDLPIVALTGKTDKSDEQACLEAGMDAYFLKPVKKEDYEKILLKCKTIIESKAA